MLDWLFPRRAYTAEDRWGPGWTGRVGRGTAAGIAVNEDSALTFDPVFCASRIVCETESQLPFFTYKRVTTDESSNRAGDTQHAGDYYLYDLLKSAPNPDMGSEAFREGRTLHMCNYGNGFAEIEWDAAQLERRTRVVALWPIHPSRVLPVLPRGQFAQQYAQGYRYIVRNDEDNRTGTALYPDEMLHLPGVLTEDGIWGKGVIQYHRETIGAGIAARQHGAAQFGNGQIPPGIIFTNRLKDRDARKGFRQEWREIHQMKGNTEVGILGTDDKYQQLGFTNEQAQYLETSKFNVSQIARIYRIPVYMLEEYEKAASFASVEQRSIDFVVGFLCWLRRWEGQCNLKLILPRDRATYYTEHNLAGLLRGDFVSRMSGYQVALQNGIMTINEVRRLENLNSIGPAGNVNYVPLNMSTAEAMLNPPPVAAPPPSTNGDGASLDADGWTREMLVKQQQDAQRQLGHTPRRKSASGFVVMPLPEPEPPDAGEQAAGDDGEELLALPDVRQVESFDCGAACCQTVAEFFGIGGGRVAADYIRELGTTTADGTQPEAIVDWLNDHGLITTSGPTMTVADLRCFFCAGQPVIVPVQMYGLTPEYDGEEVRNETGHYIVIRGVGLGQVFYQDPVNGPGMLDAEAFDRIWHDMEADGVAADHFGIAVGQRVMMMPEPEPEEDDDEQPSPPPPKPGAPAWSSQATRAVLVEAFGRVLTKLANALARKLSSVTDMGEWVDGFFAQHRETLTAALEPAAALLDGTNGAALLERLATAARFFLASRFEKDTRATFLARLTAFSKDQAAETADELLNEVPT